MTLSLGFRPRASAEQLRIATCIDEAPARVGLGFADDGYVAACLRIAGRIPVWSNDADPGVCEEALARLGLPGLEVGDAEAILEADLRWRTPPSAPGRAEVSRVEGPLVTILVCTYNRAHLVRQALDSALAQSWPCEVLVVDDGSTDATPEVLASIDGLRVVRQVPNQGKPAALARGLQESRGEAILVLDDDDLLLPRSVEVLARALFAAPELGAVFADTVIFDDASGRPIASRPAVRVPSSMMPRAVLQQIPAMPGATLVRKRAWEASGPLDPSLVRGQDMDLFLALSRTFPIETLPLPTFRYRSHDALRGSAAGQWNKRDERAHRARFLSFVKPVFRNRWATLAPAADRDEGHAWALGLLERELHAEARQELARWPAPYTAAEAWVRERAGLKSRRRAPGSTLVLVDDGDEGALEEALAQHAADHEVVVQLASPRDTLGTAMLYWPGRYLHQPALVSLGRAASYALSSAPSFAPLVVDDPGMVPPIEASEAVRVAAAVLDAPRPSASRAVRGRAEGPVATLAWRAREALREGRPAEAIAALTPILERWPTFRGGYRMASEAFAALGLASEAAQCRALAARPGSEVEPASRAARSSATPGRVGSRESDFSR